MEEGSCTICVFNVVYLNLFPNSYGSDVRSSGSKGKVEDGALGPMLRIGTVEGGGGESLCFPSGWA